MPRHSMLHHLSLGVRDLGVATAFYDAVLGALGYRRVFDDDDAVGYGIEDGEDLLCLKLRRAAVGLFHAAGLQAGGQDNGAPGLREDYGPTYYAAFLVDPDCHPIEAVCKAPDGRDEADARAA